MNKCDKNKKYNMKGNYGTNNSSTVNTRKPYILFPNYFKNGKIR